MMPPHAKCPVYDRSKQYSWSNVEVLEYDPATMRFKVRMMSSLVEKWVGRLSLMFLSEDQVKFQERVELSKQRQRNADDEMRFLSYVSGQTERVASSIPQEMKSRVQEFAVIRQLPYLRRVEESGAKAAPMAANARQDDEKQVNANV